MMYDILNNKIKIITIYINYIYKRIYSVRKYKKDLDLHF